MKQRKIIRTTNETKINHVELFNYDRKYVKKKKKQAQKEEWNGVQRLGGKERTSIFKKISLKNLKNYKKVKEDCGESKQG